MGRHDTIIYADWIDHELKEGGKEPLKGERRASKSKKTSEQMQKRNQFVRQRYVLRKMRCNFSDDDVFVTLKLKKGTKANGGLLRVKLRAFLRKLKANYARCGNGLKFMYRPEIGAEGGMHVHMVVNAIGDIKEMRKRINAVWQEFGARACVDNLYKDGEYENLVKYFLKPLDNEIVEQLKREGRVDELKFFSNYSSSRNMVEPKVEHENYSKRLVEELYVNGIVPTKGYFVKKDSVRCLYNQYTGQKSLYYSEKKLKEPLFIKRTEGN